MRSVRHALRSAEALVFVALLFGCALPGEAAFERLSRLRRTCFSAEPCITMLDSENIFGCGQCSADVISGLVSEFDNFADLENFLANTEQPNRVIMIPEQLFFRSDTLRMLPFAENVRAVLVYPGFGNLNPANQDPVREFSWDQSTPNLEFSVPSGTRPFRYNNQTEQPIFSYNPFNVFHVSAATRDTISSRVNDLQSPRNGEASSTIEAIQQQSLRALSPGFALRSEGGMFACPSAESTLEASSGEDATGNAPTLSTTSNTSACLDDQTCLPIGGHSVWSAVGSLDADAVQETGVLAVTSPMDSRAFFPSFAQGAAAEVSSLAALLAVAEAVGVYRRSDAAIGRDVLVHPVFFAWAAQAYGFTGSSRFLQDLAEFDCATLANQSDLEFGCEDPFMPSLKFQDFRGVDFTVLNIASLVDPISDAEEGGGIDAVDSEQTFFLHGLRAAPENEDADIPNTTATAIRSALNDAFNGNLEDGRNAVPPDASQSFAQYLSNVQSVSISNFQSVFTNQFYHSQFDNITRVPPESRGPIVAASTGIARAIIEVAYGEANSAVEADSETVDGVFECLASNWTETPCELAQEFLGDAVYAIANQTVTASNYAGVFVPFSRSLDQTPSQFFKHLFISTFLAYQNRIDIAGDDGEVVDVECNAPSDCADFARTINEAATSDSAFKNVFCARGLCVVSDTYSHNAFGTGLRATNAAQSAFAVDESRISSEVPEAAQFTESAFASDGFSLCGTPVDSTVYGYFILAMGLLVNIVSFVLAYLVNRVLTAKSVREEEVEEREELIEGPDL